MNERPLALLPELLLLGGAVIGLVLGLFLPRARQGMVRIVAAGTLAAAAIAAAARRSSSASWECWRSRSQPGGVVPVTIASRRSADQFKVKSSIRPVIMIRDRTVQDSL